MSDGSPAAAEGPPPDVSMSAFPTLQFLTHDAAPMGHVGQARLAAEGGVRWVQLRAKGLGRAEWTALARETLRVCRDLGARLVVNDSVDVAEAVGADGVHLGASDATPAEARRRLGPDAWIGVTLNRLPDVARLAEGRPDYVGVGPWRATATKPGHAAPHDAASLRALIAAAGLPAFAIGGLGPEDFPAARDLGAAGAAVSSAIALDPDPRAAAARLAVAARLAWDGS